MVRQTARKSTGQRKPDPVQWQMARLLSSKKTRSFSSSPEVSISESQQRAIQDANKIAMRSGGPPVTAMPYPSAGKVIRMKDGQTGAVKTRPRLNALQQIRLYQKTTSFLIPRAAFHRVVRETVQNIGGMTYYKFQSAALEAIQEAAEAYIIRLMEDSYQCSLHAKRVTLFVQDIQLCYRLRNSVL